MSLNVLLNTAIKVPLELVAAIRAVADGDLDSIAGLEQVTSAVSAAVVDAVKAFPRHVGATHSLACTPAAVSNKSKVKARAPPTFDDFTNDVLTAVSRKSRHDKSKGPGRENFLWPQRSAGTNIAEIPTDQLIDICWTDCRKLQSARYVSPTCSMAELHSMVHRNTYDPDILYDLLHDSRQVCPYRGVSQGHGDHITLSELGFTGGEKITVQIDWVASIERDRKAGMYRVLGAPGLSPGLWT